MQLEDKNAVPQEETDLPALELDDIEEMDLNADDSLEEIEVKPSKTKNRAVRKSIEQILEERALKRQLSEVFDEDILPD